MFVCVRTEHVLACALYSIPFNFICNITALKKNVLIFVSMGELRVCAMTEFVLAWRCFMFLSLKFDMKI